MGRLLKSKQIEKDRTWKKNLLVKKIFVFLQILPFNKMLGTRVDDTI